MKKRSVLAILLCLVMLFATACSPAGGPPSGPSGGGGDEDKLVVQVWNTKGGVGQEWIEQAKIRFEALNEGREFDSGKVGVEIYYEPLHDPDQSELPDSDFSVFFVGNVDYNAFKRYIMPITDIVTETSDYDNKTIESKLSDETKAALLAGGSDYYVLPHFQSYDGVTYNKTMFEQYGFYFVEDVATHGYNDPSLPNYGFVNLAYQDDVDVRTVGPNGIRGDYDDGLPSSIEEFKLLCEYMKAVGVTPFACWDAFNESYEIRLTNALWVNLEGYDGAMAQWTFNSNNVPSNIVTGFDPVTGDPISTPKVITKANAWEIYQQESRYWALDFSEYVFKRTNGVMYDTHWNSGSHTDVHREFLRRDAAMMIEGMYWMNEAKDAQTFQLYPEYLDEEVRIMPLPVQAKGRVEEGQGKSPVALDMNYSYAFINANVRNKWGSEVEQVAKEFLQFCYSDNELIQFTKNSSVLRDINYELGEVEDELNEFAKSAYMIKRDGKIINPISAEVEFIKNPSVFRMYDQHIWETTTFLADSKIKAPNIAFDRDPSEGWTVKRYFSEIKKDQTWWNNLTR